MFAGVHAISEFPCPEICVRSIRCVDQGTEVIAQVLPVELGTGVELATGCNVLVTRYRLNGVCLGDGGNQGGECLVLCTSEDITFQSFQLNADGEIVAVVLPLEAGSTSVPGALVAADELRDLAMAVDDEVRRDFDAFDLLKVGMCLPVQRVGEQRCDFTAAKLARWQADGVDDDQVDVSACWAWAEVG